MIISWFNIETLNKHEWIQKNNNHQINGAINFSGKIVVGRKEEKNNKHKFMIQAF